MIMPDVQKPHWVAKPSRNASWIGCRPCGGVRPSIVSMRASSIVSTGSRQDMTGLPSISTVQEPQAPCSQPRRAPVRPWFSRSTSSSVVPGATSIWREKPLMVSETTECFMATLPVALFVALYSPSSARLM
jgi:hypothetical protein